MKQFFVQWLIFVLWPHRQENVTTNKLMENFAVRTKWLKHNFLLLKVQNDMLDSPVDMPRSERTETPCFQRNARMKVHSDYTIVSYSQEFLLSEEKRENRVNQHNSNHQSFKV